jgi:hypothetical protein
MRPIPLAKALLAFMLLPGAAYSEIYRCESGQQTLFSDTPCGDNAVAITVEPVFTGGRLDTGTDFRYRPSPPQAEKSPGDKGCDAGYIQSTRLRHFRVKQQVQTGMSAEQVRYILGEPEHRDGQWWVYQHKGEETGRYLVQGGCLERWR